MGKGESRHGSIGPGHDKGKRANPSAAKGARPLSRASKRTSAMPQNVAGRGPSLRSERQRLRNGLFLLVDVVADHAAEDTTNGRADETTLHLVLAGHGTDHGAGTGADRRVTLRVLFR